MSIRLGKIEVSNYIRATSDKTREIISKSIESIGYQHLQGISEIGEYVFYNCKNLSIVELPNTITKIGKYAFYGCSSLLDISFNGTIEEWNNISKDTNWSFSVPASYVKCSDGQVEL